MAPAAQPIRVQVPLVVEMTAEQVTEWAADHGLSLSPGRTPVKAIVDDVQRHLLNLARGDYGLGSGASVTLKR